LLLLLLLLLLLVLLLMVMMLMMVASRFVQAEVIRIAEAKLTLPYRRRGDDRPVRLRSSPRHPVIVRERITRTPGLDTRVI